MSADPNADDMAAVQAEGDLVEFLLSLTGRSRKRPKETAPGEPTAEELAAAKKPITSHLHRPGAWPIGTRPAGPETCHPDCDCALIKPEEP